ncbi:MAG: DUF4493 domain-containing protein [Bacteroidales bacterium]|nr:DUF4493 domain-containing protein [Bacteroidales bacterium]
MRFTKIFTLSVAALAIANCADDKFNYDKNETQKGTLSFAGLSIDYSSEMVTKAEAADGTYMLYVYDAGESLVWSEQYSTVTEGTGSISLLAGDYRLDIRSTAAAVPEAKFSSPVYGASETFSITAGETTTLGTITCTLLQCAVSVEYNDDFIGMVTGDGNTSVEVMSGYPLDYALSYNSGAPKYERRIGYFAVNGDNTTMVVTFKGSIENKTQKMTTTVTDLKPRDYHIVKFMKKVDATGQVTIGIEIDGLVADAVLDNDVQASEEGDGNDPQAPVGDGGIKLVSTCDYDIAQPITVPASGNPFNLTLKAVVPNGVLRFTVDIASTNEDFINSVNTVGGTNLDLINPSEAAMGVFDIVPFPHGSELAGKTEVDFDLSGAQTAILGFPGSHTFTMNVVDKKGCKNSIDVVLVVE